MSISVPIDELAERMTEFDDALLVTVSASSRPHLVSTRPQWVDGVLVIEVGRSSVANVAGQPDVTLYFPSRTTEGFSLIVDGVGTVTAPDRIQIAPSGAVLHRPAPKGSST